MRLTKFTDYSVRVLIYAAMHAERLVTIDETAEVNTISRSHVKKVVLTLTQLGYLRGQRGRSGGFTLAKPPEEINIGELIRRTEPDFKLVECLGPNNACVLTPHCRLPPAMDRALAAFLQVFDEYTLADSVSGKLTL
ncbi:MAG: Rrf2 family transcriptional regulator [Pararhodobacter sp.]|nr:Rrf2 family transcriptional regulator [Pararhodobacter sp.]